MKETTGEKIFLGFNYVFLIILSFIFLFPFWKVLVMSFNDGIDMARGGVNFWPRSFTLDNYRYIINNKWVSRAYFITISRTILGTFLHVLLCSLMAYALSKPYFKPRKVINIMIIITMFFSGGLIPTFLVYRELHLLNSFWVYIVPGLYGTGTIFIFRAGFRSLPKEIIEDSARIDGANDLIIFWKIVFPLSLPMFATLTLFTAVGHWNDYMTAVLFINNNKLIPMQTFLYKMLTSLETLKQMNIGGQIDASMLSSTVKTTPQSIKMSTIIITATPIIMLYPFLQRYFIKGIFIGSLKG